MYLFVRYKTSGCPSYLSDHLQNVKIVIIQPNTTSSVQAMYIGVKANIKT